RPGVLRLARLDESRGAALSIPERAHARDRGGREGGGLMGVKTATGAPARLPGADATGRGSLWIWLNKRLPIGEFIESQLIGSYRAPRELLWLIGMLVYLALMAEAFMGYVLPWGNMSFWGAQVIVNLFGTIPGIGKPLVEWIRGDYGIADATLNRFFALHVAAIPLALLLLVMLHLVALRQTGSNNPDGIEIKARLGADGKPLDGIPFHPYYTVKDIVGVGVFLVLFALVVFFKPTLGGLFLEAPNFEPANPISTPEHITPVWYFTPYYAMLRAVPDQRMGALLMLLAVASFFFLPWLDRSPVKSMRYRGGISRTALALFVVAFVALGYLG